MKLSDLNLHDIGDTIQLAGAIYVDKDQRTLLCFFPEDADAAKLIAEPLIMTPDEWVTFIRQTDILETTVSARAADGTIAKAITRKSQRQIDAVVSWKVFKRDFYKCRYCGRDDVPLTVDHLVRWEEGGPSIEANLLSSCKKCNRIRGDASFADWLKHPYYVNAKPGISAMVRADNIAMLGTLDAIPRVNHVRSR